MKVIGMNINAEPKVFESLDELNRHNEQVMIDVFNNSFVSEKFNRALEKVGPEIKIRQDNVMQEDHGYSGLFDNK